MCADPWVARVSVLISLSLVIGTVSARASGPRLDREGQSRLDEIRKLYERLSTIARCASQTSPTRRRWA